MRALNTVKLTAVSCLLFLTLTPFADTHADEIVAVVNNGVILKSELDRAYAPVLNAPNTPNFNKPSQKQVLEELVTRKIQLDLAKQLGMYVGNLEIEEYIKDTLKQNKLTRSQQERILIRQGLTFQDWRIEISNSLIIRKLQLQQLRSYVKVNESEINSFLISNPPSQLQQSSYNLAHIIIDASEVTAEQIELYAGQLVNTQSVDEVTAISDSWGYDELRVNSFPYRTLTKLPELFHTQLLLTNKGEIRHFQSDGFWHILKVFDVKHAKGISRQEYKISIISLLSNIIYTGEQLKVRISDIHQQLQDDKDFNELASIYSDQTSSFQGYTLNWVPRNSLPPQLQNIIAKLKPNQFSQPFNTNDGWHIVLLEEERINDITIQQLRDQTFQLLANRKLTITLPFWINDILSRSYVEYRI